MLTKKFNFKNFLTEYGWRILLALGIITFFNVFLDLEQVYSFKITVSPLKGEEVPAKLISAILFAAFLAGGMFAETCFRWTSATMQASLILSLAAIFIGTLILVLIMPESDIDPKAFKTPSLQMFVMGILTALVVFGSPLKEKNYF